MNFDLRPLQPWAKSEAIPERRVGCSACKVHWDHNRIGLRAFSACMCLCRAKECESFRQNPNSSSLGFRVDQQYHDAISSVPQCGAADCAKSCQVVPEIILF